MTLYIACVYQHWLVGFDCSYVHSYLVGWSNGSTSSYEDEELMDDQHLEYDKKKSEL